MQSFGEQLACRLGVRVTMRARIRVRDSRLGLPSEQGCRVGLDRGFQVWFLAFAIELAVRV